MYLLEIFPTTKHEKKLVTIIMKYFFNQDNLRVYTVF